MIGDKTSLVALGLVLNLYLYAAPLDLGPEQTQFIFKR
jgi:hypothetical protein